MRQQNVVHLTKVITDWYEKAPAAKSDPPASTSPLHSGRRGGLVLLSLPVAAGGKRRRTVDPRQPTHSALGPHMG